MNEYILKVPDEVTLKEVEDLVKQHFVSKGYDDFSIIVYSTKVRSL